MSVFKALHNQTFSSGEHSIVSISYKDRMSVLKWRNEQINQLRQAKQLTEKNQDIYFNTVVNKLFDQEQPDLIRLNEILINTRLK